MQSVSYVCRDSRIALSRSQPPPRAGGFSLQELLTTLGIAGVLMVGTTSLFGMIDQQRKTLAVNDLVSLLSLARSEAIRRGREAVVCPSQDGAGCAGAGDGQTAWHQGVMLFMDEDDDGAFDPNEPVVRREEPSAVGITIKSSAARTKVTYRPNGLSSGSTITLTICGASTANQPKYIIVANTGRARVSTLPADGEIDEAIETCP